MNITGKTRLLGVLGDPVTHSLSPRLHNYWLRQLDIDAVYLPLPVTAAALPEIVRTLPQLGFVGVNATIPHKESLLKLVDRIDPVAAQIGAVNTLVFDVQNGTLGTNTDAFGFAETIRAAGHDMAVGPALVLGAGGAARAVLAALKAAGCPRIVLTNRTPERATALAAAFGGMECVVWEEWPQYLEQSMLLVNTTSCGLNGKNDIDVDLRALPTGAAVCDIVYRPLMTGLLHAAEAAGRKPIDGLGMLLYQAQASFKHWFGVTPPVDAALRAYILGEQSA